jgi:protein-L-isoaspartate(D-aspartate) O-methyltransferase
MILLCRLIGVRPSVRHTATEAGRYMVAIMNEALELKIGSKVLEVGAGSGYHAATVAEQIGPQGRVYTIELVPELVRVARSNLERAGYSDRVTLVEGDGSLGYTDRAPYDRILVTAASPKVSQTLVAQLRLGGIMIVPVGGRLFPQELLRVRKDEKGRVERSSLGGVAFVPLIGKEGFDS